MTREQLVEKCKRLRGQAMEAAVAAAFGHMGGATGLENARSALDAAIEELAASLPYQGVPEGWKLVPVEITEEMHAAAVRTIVRCTGNDDFPPRVYRAMLAASPEAPAPQPSHSGGSPDSLGAPASPSGSTLQPPAAASASIPSATSPTCALCSGTRVAPGSNNGLDWSRHPNAIQHGRALSCPWCQTPPAPTFAWAWLPSSVWGQWEVTLDPERGALARKHASRFVELSQSQSDSEADVGAPAPQGVQADLTDEQVGQLQYRGNTVSYMYDRAKVYGDEITRCWDVLRQAGKNAMLPLHDAIRAALATPPSPPAVQPDPAVSPDVQELVEALRGLVYESGGRWYAGMQGDADVTDIVGAALSKYGSKQ